MYGDRICVTESDGWRIYTSHGAAAMAARCWYKHIMQQPSIQPKLWFYSLCVAGKWMQHNLYGFGTLPDFLFILYAPALSER